MEAQIIGLHDRGLTCARLLILGSFVPLGVGQPLVLRRRKLRRAPPSQDVEFILNSRLQFSLELPLFFVSALLKIEGCDHFGTVTGPVCLERTR